VWGASSVGRASDS